jgi:basic amino acid/polyamine antiporter, APA family
LGATGAALHEKERKIKIMAQPGMFVRKASGLVRSWSVFDGFVYAFFSINLVTLGFYIFAFAPYIPEANLLTAIIISGIFIIFEIFVYGLLVAIMSGRAGFWAAV